MKTQVTFALPCILAASTCLSVADDSTLEYLSWEKENGITGAGPSADSDSDGIPNGIEFVIGGDPSGPASSSNDLLPSVTVDEKHLNVIFRRTDAAAGCNPFVEYSSAIGQWAVTEPGVDGVFIEEEVDYFGPGVTRVIVRIPRALASGSGFFARLGVEITP